MSKYIIVFNIIIVSLLLTAGCSGEKSDEPGIVDYATGAEKIRTYKKTKTKIDDVSKVLKARYEITD